MLHILLFVLYFLLLCFLVNRISFTSKSGLGFRWINFLFILKVTAGLAIGWISARYYPEGNDYWTLNRYGIEETELLKKDPAQFFVSLFQSHYNHYDGFFISVGSYWNDLKNNIVIKFLAICNLASGGNYYINSLFFSFISFFGHVALFRIFYTFHSHRKMFIIAGAFLIPSTLYFSSGIHKDSIVFAALGLFSWALFTLTATAARKKLILLMVCAVAILFIRSHVFAALIPATIAYLLATRKLIRRPFQKTYVAAALFLLILSFIPSVNPFAVMARKQQDFFALPEASSQLAKDTLQPTPLSVLKNTPQALVHGFAEPLPWKFPGEPLMILGFEALLILAFFLFWIFNHDKRKPHPVYWYCILLAIPLILFAGYIVPNAGSIIRYRAIYLPWLLLPLLTTLKIKHISFKNM